MENNILSDTLLEAEKHGFIILKYNSGEYYCTSQCNCCQKSFQYKVDIRETSGKVEIDTLRLYCDTCVNKTKKYFKDEE